MKSRLLYISLFILLLSSASLVLAIPFFDLFFHKDFEKIDDKIKLNHNGDNDFRVYVDKDDGTKDKDMDIIIIENTDKRYKYSFAFGDGRNHAKIKIDSAHELSQIDEYRLGYPLNDDGLYQIYDFSDLKEKNNNSIISIYFDKDAWVVDAQGITDWDPVIYRDYITKLGQVPTTHYNTTVYHDWKGIGMNYTCIVCYNFSVNETTGHGPLRYNMTLQKGAAQPTWLPAGGYYGTGALEFDGGDYLYTPYQTNDTLDMTVDDDFTITVRFNASPTLAFNIRLFDHYGISASRGYIGRLMSGKCDWSLFSASNVNITDSIQVNDGKFHECTFVYKGSNDTSTLYRDGAEIGSAVQTGAFSVATTNLTLGARQDQALNLIGQIDKFEFVNYAKSKNEVLASNFTQTLEVWDSQGFVSIPYNNSANHTVWKNITIDCAIYSNQGYNGSSCGNNLIVNVSYSNQYPTSNISEIATFYQQVGNTTIYNLSGNNEYFFANATISNLSTGGNTIKFISNVTFGYETSNDLYVALTGADNNPGTFAQPYHTISKAYNSSAAGNKIYIGSGAFNETIWSSAAMTVSKANIYFIGNGTNRTTIRVQSPTISYGFLLNVDGTKLYNFTLDGDSRRLYAGSDFVGVCVAINNNKNNSIIDGINFQNCSTSAILADPATNFIQKNTTIINSYFWNNTGTNVIDLVNGGQQNLNISFNNFDLSFASGQLGIAQDTGGQGANNNGSGLYIGYNNFTTHKGTPSYYSTAIYLDTNWTRGFQGAKIENNNFGDATRGFYGLALRTREMNALNFTNNNLYINNSVGRNVVHLEAQNENITVAGNRFCLTGSPCNNSGSGTFVLSESSSYLTVANNTGIFSDVDDIYWAYSDLTNTTNIRMENNNINMTMRTNTAHLIGIGEEGSSSNETYYGVITNNTIYIPTTGNYAEHSVFLGYCWYCNVSFNRVIGGEYGLASKGNRESNLWNNTLINQTLVSIYDKWGNYTIYENNTILSQINGINVIQISTGGGNSKNINFTRNNINISLTDNTTTGLFQDSTSHNLYSNYNIWHFPYYEFNQSFKNGSTFMNWTVWNVTNGQDINSTFLPFFTALPPSDLSTPHIHNQTPINGTIFLAGTVINISANITDHAGLSINDTYVNITYPNTTVEHVHLYQWLGDNYRFNWTSPNLAGNYTLKWYANDTLNNINATEDTYFTIYTAVYPYITNISLYSNNFALNETVYSNATYNINITLNGSMYWLWYINGVNVQNNSFLNISNNTQKSTNLTYNFSYGDVVTCSIYAIANFNQSSLYSCGSIQAVQNLDSALYDPNTDDNITLWGYLSFIAVLGLVTILLIKVHNVLNYAERREMAFNIILVACAVILFVVQLVVYFNVFKVDLLNILLYLSGFILILILILFFIEIMFHLKIFFRG
ncbi:MAG: concanavalin A-like lectin/glucanase [Siphoviridae sp. ctjeG17]|nr:MAG: concanavalin A-like lectin/glucanase [Siphoviridae sp. ctjeG17]